MNSLRESLSAEICISIDEVGDVKFCIINCLLTFLVIDVTT